MPSEKVLYFSVFFEIFLPLSEIVEPSPSSLSTRSVSVVSVMLTFSSRNWRNFPTARSRASLRAFCSPSAAPSTVEILAAPTTTIFTISPSLFLTTSTTPSTPLSA
jgi:hypothetical protein